MRQGEYILDPVVGQWNTEHPYTRKYDKKVDMEIQVLNGPPESFQVLSFDRFATEDIEQFRDFDRADWQRSAPSPVNPVRRPAPVRMPKAAPVRVVTSERAVNIPSRPVPKRLPAAQNFVPLTDERIDTPINPSAPVNSTTPPAPVSQEFHVQEFKVGIEPASDPSPKKGSKGLLIGAAVLAVAGTIWAISSGSSTKKLGEAMGGTPTGKTSKKNPGSKKKAPTVTFN